MGHAECRLEKAMLAWSICAAWAVLDMLHLAAQRDMPPRGGEANRRKNEQKTEEAIVEDRRGGGVGGDPSLPAA